MVAPLGPCGGNKLGVGHLKEKGVFLSSVFKCFVKFHPNIVGNLIMGRDDFFIKWSPWLNWTTPTSTIY